jgi:hypothetical protein
MLKKTGKVQILGLERRALMMAHFTNHFAPWKVSRERPVLKDQSSQHKYSANLTARALRVATGHRYLRNTVVLFLSTPTNSIKKRVRYYRQEHSPVSVILHGSQVVLLIH